MSTLQVLSMIWWSLAFAHGFPLTIPAIISDGEPPREQVTYTELLPPKPNIANSMVVPQEPLSQAEVEW